MNKITILATTVLAMGMVACSNSDKKAEAQEETTEQQRPLTLAETNLQAGQAFLAENGQREGVITTPSGLQYEVITEGKGKKPSATDVVEVNYEGRFLNGSVFDSSYERNETATFPLNHVIAGWTEGVQLMSEGSKYRFYIPANLAYGPNGYPGAIGPNETLIFEVELVSVK